MDGKLCNFLSTMHPRSEISQLLEFIMCSYTSKYRWQITIINWTANGRYKAQQSSQRIVCPKIWQINFTQTSIFHAVLKISHIETCLLENGQSEYPARPECLNNVNRYHTAICQTLLHICYNSLYIWPGLFQYEGGSNGSLHNTTLTSQKQKP